MTYLAECSNSLRGVAAGVLLLGLAAGGMGCDTQEASPNKPPQIAITNVPPAGATRPSVQVLYWDGTDTDGFVPAYEYRYRSVYYQDDGDSTKTGWKPGEGEEGWKQTEKTRLRLAFDSQGELNRQIFQVRAIDNEGMTSEPAEKVLFTKRSIPPTTEIASPTDGASMLVTPDGEVTDWWQGVRLTYTASDPNEDGAVVEYAWAADDGPWHWTEDTTVVVNPQAFNQPLRGEHTLRVQSRDNTDLTSKVATARITLIQPSFDKDVLIVDETDESVVPFSKDTLGAAETDVILDQFYGEVFQTLDPKDWWDYQERGAPSKEKLSKYKLVIWHADNNFANASNPHALPEHSDVISEYMNVGGDFIMSGWRMLASFAPSQFGSNDQARYTFPDTTFVRTYLHIKTARQTGLPDFEGGDFAGAGGTGSFRTVRVDSSKLAGISPYNGFPTQTNVISEPASFTEAIYRYTTRTAKEDFAGLPVGLRYHGTTFDTIVFGFPIYFLRDEDARALGADVLQSLGNQ